MTTLFRQFYKRVFLSSQRGKPGQKLLLTERLSADGDDKRYTTRFLKVLDATLPLSIDFNNRQNDTQVALYQFLIRIEGIKEFYKMQNFCH